jgi:protein-disulfide isomerase-like protein with CxxC motif
MNRKVKIMKKFYFLSSSAAVSSLLPEVKAPRAGRTTARFKPGGVRAFFQRFRNAVEKSDKTAVAALTAFPFSYGFDAAMRDDQSAVYQTFQDGFSAMRAQRFLKERNPLFSRRDRGSYVVSTDEAAHFYFVRTRTRF